MGNRVNHLDPAKLTCFSFINDENIRMLLLVNTVVFLPLTLYFYAHILHTIVQSAKLMHRSQKVNVHLAKVFSLISLITFVAHVPGAVFALMDHQSVCKEMIRDVLMDLPLLANPIILICMNKEVRSQCLLLLRRYPADHCMEKPSISTTDKQRESLTSGQTDILDL